MVGNWHHNGILVESQMEKNKIIIPSSYYDGIHGGNPNGKDDVLF